LRSSARLSFFWNYVQSSFKAKRQFLFSKVDGAKASPKHKSSLSGGTCEKPKHIRDDLALSQATQRRIQEGEAKIIHLLELREFTSALNLYRSFEREGLDRCFVNEKMYDGFIQSAIRVGKIDVVERMLRSLQRKRISPSMEFWHAILKMLASRKYFSCCLSIFTMYGNVLPNDKVIFSCLMNAALESGASDKAVEILSRYKQCDLEVCDYVTVFRAFVAVGEVDQAETLFKELGSKATPLMMNLLLLACVNAKQAQRAHDLLLEGHSFEDLPSSRIVDAISYNTVIKGFVADGNLKKSLDCLRSLQSHGLESDDVTLTSLLEICLAEKQRTATDCIVSLLLKKGRSLDSGTCNLFVKGLIRIGRLSKAMEIYDAMKIGEGYRAKPNIVTYSMLIKACVDVRDLERALLFLHDMQLAGEAPDEMIFGHLLEGCRLIGNQKLGERLFDDMLKAGLKPSEYTLTMMVKLYGRCSSLDKAYSLVASWESEYGQRPSVIHFTCLVSGCLRLKQYDQAWRAYELMELHGVVADAMMISTLAPAMQTCQRYDRILHMARHASKSVRAVATCADTLRMALSHMSSTQGAEKEAEELRQIVEK
jgi:pentatricopeptide repeat protein